jgi:hypothetical protein
LAVAFRWDIAFQAPHPKPFNGVFKSAWTVFSGEWSESPSYLMKPLKPLEMREMLETISIDPNP